MTESRIRRFYREHLAFPFDYGILAATLTAVMGLLMAWAGYRGKFQPWGDPIPFVDALAKVPGFAALGFAVVFIGFLIFRVRF